MINALPYLALSMGLLSSFHCIAMCGPIALALPVQKGNRLQQFAGLAFYNIGRTFTYAALGIALGSLGYSFAWIGYLTISFDFFRHTDVALRTVALTS